MAASIRAVLMPVQFHLSLPIGYLSLKLDSRAVSKLAEVASTAEFVEAEHDQNERNCVEHPARMAAARRPKVA